MIQADFKECSLAIKVIFLDFGNVCATFNLGRFYEQFAQETGVSEEKQRQALNGGTHGYSKLFADFECGLIGPSKFFHLLTTELDCAGRISYGTFATMWTDIILRENVELNYMLDWLPQKKFLLSNTNRIFYGRHIAHTDIIRKHIPVRTQHILSCNVGAIKPDTRIYHSAFAAGGRPTDECFFVDDLPVNMASWRGLGGHGVVYHAGQHKIDRLVDALQDVRAFD